jgi:hypothetical protein
VEGSKLVAIGGAGHEIHIDQTEDCKNTCLEFLATLKKDAGRLKTMNTTSQVRPAWLIALATWVWAAFWG